jgi:NADPH:quinone reductase-like Zn-dependent oxidoreductase
LTIRIGKPANAGSLLVVGGAGGVGSIAIQLARHLTGLTVIATASRPETQAWSLEMGAHHVIKSLPADRGAGEGDRAEVIEIFR